MILITGAAGFIGCNIARKFNELGETDLLLTDSLGTGSKWKNLVDLRYSDYMEKEYLLDYLEKDNNIKLKAIFHLGACSSTTEQDASYLVDNNYEYTKELAKWAVNRKIPFIYASSAATYGDGSLGYNDNEQEIHKLRPLNMYGYSKQMFDLWALKHNLFNKIHGIKYFNVYGPYEFHKGPMRSMVLKAYEQIKATGMVKLFKSDHPDYKDGEQMRDFIYIEDAVEMTISFFMLRTAPPGIYNVGTGKARSWNDMMVALFKSLNLPVRIEYIDMPQELKKKYQYFTEANMQKLTRGGFGKYISTLEEGVEKYAAFLESRAGEFI